MNCLNDVLTIILATFGALVIIHFLLNQLWGVLQLIREYLAPFFLPYEENNLVKKYGSWALITGCTDGIGKAYAFELARNGLNLVLVSRSEDKLKQTAEEIESVHAIKTKIIVADFAKGRDAAETVREKLAGLKIGILVNNVGKMYDYPMYLDEVPENVLWDIITINVGAVTALSRIFIETMKSDGRGAIVNVSSGSEVSPLPLATVYAATKAYIKSFSAALRAEYTKYGITIQHLSPMFTNTKMNAYSDRLQKDQLFIPSAETYAKHAIRTLGKIDTTTGYWAHGLQYSISCIPPVWIRTIVGHFMMNTFRNDYFKQNSAFKN